MPATKPKRKPPSGGRPRKALTEDLNDLPATDPIAQEQHTHRITRQWSTAVPVAVTLDTPATAPDVDDDDDDDRDDYDDDQPAPLQFPPPNLDDLSGDDLIDAIISDIGALKASYSLAVYRLPNFARDERIDGKSRVYVGILQIPSADYLLEERYREEIQQRFARAGRPNIFLCQIRRNNKFKRYLPEVLHLEPLEDAPRENPPADFFPTAPADFAGIPAKPSNPLRDLREQLKMLAEFREMLMPPAPPPPVQLPPALDPQTTLIQALITDPQIRESVFSGVRGLIGPPPAANGFLDVAQNLISSPTVQRGLSALMEGFGAMLSRGAGVPASIAAPGIDDAPAPAPAPAPNPAWTVFLEHLSEQSDAAMCADRLAALADAFPDDPTARAILRAVRDNSEQKVLDDLARQIPAIEPLCNAPNAAAWVTSLKTAIADLEKDDPAA